MTTVTRTTTIAQLGAAESNSKSFAQSQLRSVGCLKSERERWS